LAGIIWPIPPPQVAHYAAVMLGTTVLLWMCRAISGRGALAWIVVTFATLIAAHTRTAVLALVAGLVCALASLFLSQTRVRRTFFLGGTTVVLVGALFASEIRSWALRGQSAQDVGDLTGRTKVWSQVLSTPRSPVHDLFGSGLSNLSWDGLPIDSTWVGTYLDEGLFGVVVVAALVVFLLLSALSDRPGPGRAIAIFLIVYCVFASITETGLGAPSPYLLDLMVAASLIGIHPTGTQR
jgi:O-antigen ligase